VSNTYCLVFLFCFPSSCVLYVASFSRLSIFAFPFSILYRLFIRTQVSSLLRDGNRNLIIVLIMEATDSNSSKNRTKQKNKSSDITNSQRTYHYLHPMSLPFVFSDLFVLLGIVTCITISR
jgi:hypothetical protein